jgi:hypothetical protein
MDEESAWVHVITRNEFTDQIKFVSKIEKNNSLALSILEEILLIAGFKKLIVGLEQLKIHIFKLYKTNFKLLDYL